MESFWKHVPKPFFAMAPMADVTDAAFRAVVGRRGRPDVFWTEFVSADGLFHTREIQHIPDTLNPLIRDLAFTPDQHPIVAQIFSSKPEMITYATKLVAELGFDGVDLNMGCPDRSVEKQGAGSALIKKPEQAIEIIRAAKSASAMPVSVKTRIGYNQEILEDWLAILLKESPAAITIHLRTRKEMSLVPANWDLMKRAVEIRNCINPDVLLIGNGDVEDLDQGKLLAADTGCDGVMIGRGMFGNPWVFEGLHDTKWGFTKPPHTLEEKLDALIELAYGFENITPSKNFSILKKHIKAFVTGFDSAAELRAKLMAANSAADLDNIVNNR
ncbi:hypothetical protein A3G63_03090 [Candidatus Kaiserbacteria bacterium RIFCSPLOWO2_12_FULL_52_8]|uniref:tRNA-dihydrouridine synthase n=1 Tax=Candidatus Kaiserbacteria bacterium RIFCSPHIGHO2_01_FULL_53_31 TaxID=1798481 RepID=A0A1F6CJR6_9BACT|nr:MAG: hypothetical protein A2678_00665 [Candidatus Kaiserbacteria bacterium RIFCSPHIGHO2_01_FULL_53_31]OGG94577.1 MAG: hypothetical protein A3G63_03090 [Candidatus Kaiserbacteria bacterium RIFCSPLOWO2_12_FULL_52_8]